MEYIGTCNGIMVKATYEMSDYRINVSGIKVMVDGAWEEQTDDAFEDWSDRILRECGDDMASAH